MSADRRKRKRKHQALLLEQKIHELTPNEKIAERQGKAICRHYQQVIHAPRLRTTYYLDGVPMRTNFKHRKIS